MTTPTLSLVTWEPWKKIVRWSATHGRYSTGPYSVSVWYKRNPVPLVNLTLHNRTSTWSTWLDLTPDEALRLAHNILTAVRKAQAVGEAAGD